MKKPLKIIAFVLVLILSITPITALANEMFEDFEYEVDKASDEVKIIKYRGFSPYVVIPDSIEGYPVTNIAAECFKDKTFIEGFYFPETISHFGDYAFEGTNWLKNYPDDFVVVNNILIKYKGENATVLNNVPANVEIIGYGAFDFCNFKEIVLPEGLLQIYPAAFYDCSKLKSITIPKNVNFIDVSAFSKCTSLEKIVVSVENKHYSSVDGALLDKSEERLIYCPEGMLGLYFVPYSVKTIDKNAFSDCSNLYSVILPEGIIKIDDWVFARCYSLTDIKIPDSVESIGYWSFGECSALKNVSLGSGLKSIDDMAFVSCPNLKSINVSDRLEFVGDYALGCLYEHIDASSGTISKVKDFIIRVDNSEDIIYTSSPIMKYVLANGFDFVIENNFERALGDVDGNEKISAVDARMALRASARLVYLSVFEQAAADINKDGKITAIDARAILRVSARLESFD